MREMLLLASHVALLTLVVLLSPLRFSANRWIVSPICHLNQGNETKVLFQIVFSVNENRNELLEIWPCFWNKKIWPFVTSCVGEDDGGSTHKIRAGKSEHDLCHDECGASSSPHPRKKCTLLATVGSPRSISIQIKREEDSLPNILPWWCVVPFHAFFPISVFVPARARPAARHRGIMAWWPDHGTAGWYATWGPTASF